MTGGTSGPQAVTKPCERCLTRTARGGAPTAAAVSSASGPRYAYQLGETTLHLGAKQRLFLAVLKRYTGQAVSQRFLWDVLYGGRFRCPASANHLRPIVGLLRQRLPPDWRITTVYGYGYYLEKVTE